MIRSSNRRTRGKDEKYRELVLGEKLVLLERRRSGAGYTERSIKGWSGVLFLKEKKKGKK